MINAIGSGYRSGVNVRPITAGLALLAVVVAASAIGCAEPKVPPPPAPSSVRGGVNPETGEVRYLAIGDSITQGIGSTDFEADAFPAKLAARWRAKGCKVELQNVGVAGYTAQEMIATELPAIAPFRPTIITFQGGANDIANDVTQDKYRTNIRIILDAAKRSGARVVVIGQNEWWKSPEGPGYGGTQRKRDAYDAILFEETKARGVELVDLRFLYRQHADKNLWAEDGIHPTAAAYDEVAAELARVITMPCKKQPAQ